MGLAGWVIIGAMLAVNGVFAAYELALASVSLGRLRMAAEQRRHGAAAALAMKDRMEASLAVVQIGITLAGAIAAATGGAGAEESLAPRLQSWFGMPPALADLLSVTAVVLPLAAVTIVAGELVPKSLAIRHAESMALSLSPGMRVFALVVYPVVLAFEWLTKILVRGFERRLPAAAVSPYDLGLVELQAQVRALRASRVIGADQERIIVGSSALAKVRAGEILVPAQEVVMLDVQSSIGELLIAIHLDGYTRFPVTEVQGDPQRIVGYVNIKDIFFLAQCPPAEKEDSPLRRIIRPLTEVTPSAPIGQVFSLMMREHVHLVLVREPNGPVLGIITLEDILEEIVGDIQDEFDRLPRRVEPSGQRWIVGGGATLEQLRRVLGNRPELADLDPRMAFSEWLRRHMPAEPRGGEAVTVGGLCILVRKIRRRKVMDAFVSTQPGA